MKKRIFLIALCLFIVVIPLAGCNKGSVTNSTTSGLALTPATLTFMTADASPALDADKEVIANFQKANPNVKVEVSVVTGIDTFVTALKTKIAAGTPPDVFKFQSGTRVQEFAAAGVLYDLTGKPVLSQVDPAQLATVKYLNRVYGMPVNITFTGLFVNQDALKKYTDVTIPQNYGELITALKQLQKDGVKYPLDIAGKDQGNVWQINAQYIAQCVLAENPNYYKDLMTGKMKFTDPIFQTLLQKYAELKTYMNPDLLGVDMAGASKRFIAGESIFWIAHGSTAQNISLIDPTFNYIVEPGVMEDNTANRKLNTGVSDCLQIIQQSKYIDQDLALVSFFSTKESGNIMVTKGGLISIVKGVTATAYKSYAPIQSWLNDPKTATKTVPTPDIVWVPGLKDDMKVQTQNWLLGKSASDTLAAWQAKNQALLAANPTFVANMNSLPY